MNRTTGLVAAMLLAAVSMSVQADGQAIYDKHCKGCHIAGVGGAPKPGDAAAWDARKAKGLDAMVAIVVSGKGAMPAKGTCATCDTETLKSAVEVLVAQ